MKKHTLLLIAIFYSYNLFAIENSAINQTSGVNITTSNQLCGQYIKVENKMGMFLQKSPINTGSTCQFYTYNDALNDLDKQIDEIKASICKGRFIPESITISGPLISATWLTKTLCK